MAGPAESLAGNQVGLEAGFCFGTVHARAILGVQSCGCDSGDAVRIRDCVDLEDPAAGSDEAHNYEGPATDDDDRAGGTVDQDWDHPGTGERSAQDRAPSDLRRASDDHGPVGMLGSEVGS